MLNLSQLKTKWETEKNSYIKKEVGDGVQKFVKNVLKSPNVFNLREGLNSTPLEKRHQEFKEEEAKKTARHADVVIFVNPEIIIPMEIERYKNITAGEKQIFQYQLDWGERTNRRYGILTDGWTWRFYNNNEYREFSLQEMLGKTELFLEFWREYIKPEFYYLSFFEQKGQASLLKEVETLKVEECRHIFFEDITKLIRSFKNKLQLEGYLKNLILKEREKTAVEITYAYIIQFILYKTLVDNEFSGFKKEFADRQQAIYGCLRAEQLGEILGVIDGISNQISKNIYRPFAEEQKFINQKLWEVIHQPKKQLSDVSPWLDIFIFIKKYNFSNVRNEIFGYIYENYLKELYEDTKKGQYFTDAAMVNFMLKQVGYDTDEIKKRLANKPEDDYISIIDPSCGSGTFLYSAVDQIIKAVPNGSRESSKKIEDLVNNNVFGLDIAEFPLYLAEMNIVMRMLPLIINEKYNNPIEKKIKVFKTQDSVAEFLDTALKNTVNDTEVAFAKSNGQMCLFTKELNLGYQSYVRDEDDLKEMKKSLENQAILRRRFDFVVGNPPYVSYNECSKQRLLIIKWIQEGKVQMSDIYGVNLNTVPGRVKTYAPKPNFYAFFIALGISLLKDGGKLCYIIPQTILTAIDLDVIRYHLAKFTTIEKIITFSGKMFISRGVKENKTIATSSLIFVVRRQSPSKLHQVEVVHYKSPNDTIHQCLQNIADGKKISKKKILQNKFLQNIGNWNFIKHNKQLLNFYIQYKRNTEDMSTYYNHVIAEQCFKSKFYFDKGLVFPKNKIVDISKVKEYANYFYLIKPVKEKCNLLLTDKVIRQSDIYLPKGSQGMEVYERRYKIIWSYMNADKFYFTDKRVMLNFNWVVISADNRKEMYYILALLNSSVNRFMFDNLLKSENEKDILIGIKTIKEFVRVPKITEDNQFIKDEIIKKIEEMLALEEVKLTDLVDFSAIMTQKFDGVSVEKDALVLQRGNQKIKCEIKKNKNLVEETIQKNFGYQKLFDNQKITLAELKSLTAFDSEKQKRLKNYIDDLVFALYFNVRIKEVGFEKASFIKNKCGQNEFYSLVNS